MEIINFVIEFWNRHQDLLGPGSQNALFGILQTCALNLALGLIPGSRIDNWVILFPTLNPAP